MSCDKIQTEEKIENLGNEEVFRYGSVYRGVNLLVLSMALRAINFVR